MVKTRCRGSLRPSRPTIFRRQGLRALDGVLTFRQESLYSAYASQTVIPKKLATLPHRNSTGKAPIVFALMLARKAWWGNTARRVLCGGCWVTGNPTAMCAPQHGLVERPEGSGKMETSTFPVHFELVPGKLGAKVHFHEIDTPSGSLPCWTYTTKGLLAHGQKELIFTLRCEPHEPVNTFPDDPLHLFTFINQLAQNGQLVDAGGVSQFGEKNFLGRHLAYIPSQPLQGEPVQNPAIVPILVTEDEAVAVQEFGITRLMSRLGFVSRHYPCPPWSNRTRPGLSFEHTRQKSILARVARFHAPGVRIVRENQRVVLRITPQAREPLQRHLAQSPKNTPIALLTDIDPTANACLVWEPGQPVPTAITPPHSDGSRLCGCFVLFVPAQKEEEIRFIEDGFSLLLSNRSWSAVRKALMKKRALTIPAGGDGSSLSIEWTAA